MKKAFLILGVVLLILLLWNWSLVLYGARQGMGQLKIIWGARPIKEVLDDPAFPDSLKQKLRIIDDIKAYAIDSLGLKDTKNYQTVYDQKGEELMWVVTACEPFQLKPKMWDFPIVGEVPYKGYFNKDRAVAEMQKLKAEGWDVGIRNPGGWSTLGWFTDPILSGMLERSEGDLASLIMHEMVHATLFVKDSVVFNENLASFIADTAAYDFTAWKYGKNSPEYEKYLYEAIDYQAYSNHILRGGKALDSLYKTMTDTEPREQKEKKKEMLIRKIVDEMDTLTLHAFKIPTARFREKLPNNDYFMNYMRYQAKQTNFREELQRTYGGDLRRMIEDFTKRFPFL